MSEKRPVDIQDGPEKSEIRKFLAPFANMGCVEIGGTPLHPVKTRDRQICQYTNVGVGVFRFRVSRGKLARPESIIPIFVVFLERPV